MKVPPEITKKCMEECFEDVRGIVYQTIRNYTKTNRLSGNKVEEVESAALYGFVMGYVRYEHDRSKFTTNAGNYCYWAILDQAYEEGRHQNMQELQKEPLARREFNLENFLNELSEDACFVAKLAIEMKKFKRTIRKTLRSMGWGTSRILEAFSEIREALK